MPIFDDTMDRVTTTDNYRFTATKVQDLGASEYTLVSIICDASPSVGSWKKEMERCIQQVVQSCRQHPRSANLMVRLCSFSDRLTELHGFKELRAIDDKDYAQILSIGNCTALFDATFEGLGATASYSDMLAGSGLNVNAIAFIITDGEDNSSRRNPNEIARKVRQIQREERLSTLTTVLVGVNAQGLNQYLTRFRDEAEIDHYLDLGKADADALSRLAGFMSRSIHITSTSLGSGVPPTGVALAI